VKLDFLEAEAMFQRIVAGGE
jgi:hypothetical protein